LNQTANRTAGDNERELVGLKTFGWSNLEATKQQQGPIIFKKKKANEERVRQPGKTSVICWQGAEVRSMPVCWTN